MFGMNSCNFLGRFTKDVVLQNKGNGDFCYFTLAINYPDWKDSTGAAHQRQSDFLNFKASGAAAKTIAQYGQKGKWMLVYDCSVHVKAPNSVVENGKTIEYRDVEFTVSPGHFRIFSEERVNSEGKDGGVEANNAPASAPAPVMPAASNGEHYVGYVGDMPQYDPQEESVAGELPF